MFKNPQDVSVFMGSENVSASIVAPGLRHVFAFNPDEVKWGFSNNTVSRDTIGGRVVQLLSSKVEQMTVVGRAGSRGELQRLALNLKKIMNYQIKNQTPVRFKVPSRDWNFKVYLQNISSLGWDYAATSYPYEITLLVQDNLTGLTSKSAEGEALQRLAEGIGYSDKFHGGNADNALAISDSYVRASEYLRNFSTLNKDQTDPVGNGFVPEYGTAPMITGPPGIQFYMNIPETNFKMRTGRTPQFVFDRPYLYKWVQNGTMVIFQYDAMISFIKVVRDAQRWIWGINNGGTFRTYQEQVDTYNRKPDVAAKPGTSFHEIGIAIDIASAAQQTQSKVIKAFENNQWYRFAPEPDGEPWHWSYLVEG